MIRLRNLGLRGILSLLLATSPVLARDVAFVEPGGGGGSTSVDEAFKIEPKSEIDIGDSILNIVRRQSLFFVNQTASPIKVEKIAISSDSTVSPQIVNDDCSKQSIIPPLSRCSVELAITPIGPGSWGIELLMTHNGTGRITRAKINGKTSGTDSNDKKDRGLFLTNKEARPIDFGEVTVGSGKVVRSALMVNDSASTITLYSIDVIEADKSLQHLEQGCSADMDLKPGESCPVTLVWSPTTHETISTDLIIRHSGLLGFAVVPIRGNAKIAEASTSTPSSGQQKSTSNSVPSLESSPTANEVAREAAKALPIPRGHSNINEEDYVSTATGSLHLIGTVGNRAVLLKPDGTTAVVQAGEQINIGGVTPAKVLSTTASSATLMIDGKKQDLLIEAVKELKAKAAAHKASIVQKPSGKNGIANSGGNDE